MRSRHLARSDAGSAAAELAMVFPLLLILGFGSFEVGYYFWSEHITTKAVRDGVRYAGRQSFLKYPCASGTIDPTTESNIKNVTLTGQVAGGTARVSNWTASHISVAMTCAGGTTTGIYRSNAGGAPIVTVSVDVPYDTIFGRATGFSTDGLRVRANAQTAVMGV